jgi:hypothetical protein
VKLSLGFLALREGQMIVTNTCYLAVDSLDFLTADA